jgi:hypothetical protein
MMPGTLKWELAECEMVRAIKELRREIIVKQRERFEIEPSHIIKPGGEA